MDYAAYEADRKKLAARIVAVRQIIQDTTDPQERIRQTERLRILRGMYKDTLDNLERLRPPQEKHRKEQQRKISLDGFSWDFLERTKTTFADLEGTTWQAVEEGGLTAKQAAALQKVLQRAVEKLSDRQRAYFFAHADGQTLAKIAETYGVNVSTVSRTVARAEKILYHTICAHAFVGECISPDGVDLLRLATRANLLTLRQREMLYFLLTDGVSIREISEIVHRDRSTVCRSNAAVLRGFAGVCLDMAEAVPRKIARSDWPGGSEAEIAAMLGLPKGFYYRFVCRDERVGPYTRYEYEILARRGMTVREAAADLGISQGTVKRYWQRYPDADLSQLHRPVPYSPSAPRYVEGTPSIRKALSTLSSNGNTIGDAVSAETYRKMLRISGGEA